MAKILIAEDDQDVQKFCTFALQKDGHTVVAVDSGTEALEKLRSERPDLLILDVMLPGMDGYSVQLQVSQDPLLNKIPVLIVTALKPAKELFNKFDQVAGFLAKPFGPEALSEAVRQGLQKKVK